MRARWGRRLALGGVALAVTATGLSMTATSAVSAPAAKTDPRANDLGIQVVRFAKGTSPAQMRQAVSKAGATVVTDLSKLNALAVVPAKAAGFGTRIKAQKGVRGAWLDRHRQTRRLGACGDPGRRPSATPGSSPAARRGRQADR